MSQNCDLLVRAGDFRGVAAVPHSSRVWDDNHPTISALNFVKPIAASGFDGAGSGFNFKDTESRSKIQAGPLGEQ